MYRWARAATRLQSTPPEKRIARRDWLMSVGVPSLSSPHYPGLHLATHLGTGGMFSTLRRTLAVRLAMKVETSLDGDGGLAGGSDVLMGATQVLGQYGWCREHCHQLTQGDSLERLLEAFSADDRSSNPSSTCIWSS